MVGGHSGTTIVPVLSPFIGASFPESEHAAMTTKIQTAGTVVVEAKAGKGSATLSMGAAAAYFVGRIIAALGGAPGVRECAYVAQDSVKGLAFFAHPVTFGTEGVEEIHDITGSLSADETARVEEAKKQLAGQIKKGLDFVVVGRRQAGSKL